MGYTVLAHALFSCNKIDIELDTFFSPQGNSHRIYEINNTNLTAHHMIELPDNDIQCIIELVPDEWNNVLRLKMSYSKFFNDFPTPTNYKKFFNRSDIIIDEDVSWKEFYNNVKDPSWPECDSYKMIDLLDDRIKNEILSLYQPPQQLIDDNLFLEILSQTYFEMLGVPYHKQFDTSETYYISDYFSGNTAALENACCKIFGWTWDQQRSNEFLNKVLEVNATYFDWLDNIKDIYQKTINFVECSTQLKLWEQAIVVAKCCETFKISPKQLEWHNAGCILDENNVLLIKLLKKVKHGKTI